MKVHNECRPIHTAIGFSPHVDDINLLLSAYPVRISVVDNDGNLPFRLKCMNQCRSSIISNFIELYQ
jgi:hypothetical protein